MHLQPRLQLLPPPLPQELPMRSPRQVPSPPRFSSLSVSYPFRRSRSESSLAFSAAASPLRSFPSSPVAALPSYPSLTLFQIYDQEDDDDDDDHLFQISSYFFTDLQKKSIQNLKKKIDCKNNAISLKGITHELLPRRPDLRLILMSATFDAQLFSSYFNDTPAIHIPGFTYQVHTHFLEDILEMTGYRLTPDNQIDDYGQEKAWKMNKQTFRKRKSQIATVVEDALCSADFKEYSSQTHESLSCWNPDSMGFYLIEYLLCGICEHEEPGAVLVFLTGWDDISSVKEKLQSNAILELSCLPIMALWLAQNRRRVGWCRSDYGSPWYAEDVWEVGVGDLAGGVVGGEGDWPAVSPDESLSAGAQGCAWGWDGGTGGWRKSVGSDGKRGSGFSESSEVGAGVVPETES
ncbi:hypothetical protein V2J09_022400 [Rumex salicifolius]